MNITYTIWLQHNDSQSLATWDHLQVYSEVNTLTCAHTDAHTQTHTHAHTHTHTHARARAHSLAHTLALTHAHRPQ